MIAIDTAKFDARRRDLRVALEEQRRFRLAQLDELAGEPSADASASSGASDDVAHALRRGARFALAEIEAALKRMDSGRYGICQECDSAIAIERLEILPMAALCLSCQHVRDTQRR
jgi:RNA polymerase-binding transcription factor DksA